MSSLRSIHRPWLSFLRVRQRAVVPVFSWVMLAFLAGAAFGQEKRALEVDDLLRISRVGSPQISPNGERVAYTVTTSDIDKDESETSIWVTSTSDGNELRMTAPGYSAQQPRWSPDGGYLSFLAERSDGDGGDGDGDTKSQVWRFDLRGGDAQRLTEMEEGVVAHEWSPDGLRLVLLIKDPDPKGESGDDSGDSAEGRGKSSPEKRPKPHVIDRLQFKRDYAGYLDRRRTHLYLYWLEHERLVQLTFGDFDDSAPAWRPDGESIVFVSNRTDEPDANGNDDLWLVSASMKEGIEGQTIESQTGDDATSSARPVQRLTSNPGSDHSPAWSPDGGSLVYSTVTQPEIIWYATQKIATLSVGPRGVAGKVATGEPLILAEELDRNAFSPRFAADGRSIYFLLEDRGAQLLAQIDLEEEGAVRRPVDGERSIGAYSVSSTGKVALLDSSGQRPPEVAVYDARGVTRLSRRNDALLEQLRLAEVEKVSFTSADGTPLQAFVTFPLDFYAESGIPETRYPTLLRIHGGPTSQYDWGFHFESQLFAAHGYLVVRVNPRGSTGYGQDFAHAIWADWGNKDFADVMAGVDYAIERGWADPDRLGVGGWSYGGILTNYVITQTERFHGAISGASEVLYTSNYGHDHYQLQWEAELGLPWENREAWERISPFNKVERITTPTLVIGGALDWNVPILNSEQLYQALRRLGRTTQLVVYPGEHHGIRRPSFQVDRYQRYLDWYERYVLKRGGE